MVLPALVVGGPSGAGKGTLLDLVRQKYGEKIGITVSHTTRTPRPGEVDGVHYHFVKEVEFLEMVKKKQFLEYAQYASNYYGTSFSTIREIQQENKLCLLEIDIQGIRQIKQNNDIDAKYIFLFPPTLETLRTRLIKRGSEDLDKVAERVARAKMELEEMKQETSDLSITNDNLQEAFSKLCCFIDKNILNT